MKKLILTLLSLLMILSVSGCSNNKQTTGLANGTFEGVGKGKGGDLNVSVTLENNEIKDITIGDNAEDYTDAMETIKANILAKNTVDVDLVSGATLTSQGLIDAVTNAIEKAGDITLLQAKDAQVAVDEREDEYNADVIVIGAGGAGLSAAIEASNNGASVIVVEKMSTCGGNTAISGGEMAAPGNWLQEQENIEDSAENFFNDIMKGGDNESDPELARVVAEGALEAANWLKDEAKVEFEDHMYFFGGHSVERSLVPLGATGFEITTKLQKRAEELGATIHTNTAAKELVVEDGKVTKVKADYNGQEITYSANNGIIIATGGFGSNLDMRVKYNPEMDEKILSTNTVGSTGDGITMAEAIGAQLVDMQYIQTYPTVDPETGILLYVGDVRLEGRAILVNKEGKRFVEELERRDVISKAVTEQTDGVSYMYWDEQAMQDTKLNETHKAEYEDLINRGILVKANSVEEACEHFGIDAAELQATIDRYNQYCEDGKDLEFNKRGELTPFSEGTCYIMKTKPGIHHTMGGIKINSDAQVINTEGEVIEGLYAAGEVTGDIHGTNRLGSDAIADITVFGRVAGRNAANAK